MGRIKKAAGPKHDATLSPALSKFAKTAVDIPLQDLPSHLATLPQAWPLPRGDLYHWIPLLNRFDSILELFIDEYGLHLGPQVKPFGCLLLAKKGTWSNSLAQGPDGFPSEKTVRLEGKFGPEGDKDLIESILDFSRLLLDNCGNRSLYNSSDRLNDLLNTTSLSLLHSDLRLAVKLAQRYHSRQRISSNNQHFHLALLASHYTFDLDKIQKLAFPISRSQVMHKSSKASSSATASSSKGKEKEGSQPMPRRGSTSSPNANDFVALCKETGDQHRSANPDWSAWGNVSFFYYPPDPTESSTKPTQDSPVDLAGPSPPTPTPSRRYSGVGTQQSSRLSRVSAADDASSTAAPVTPSKPDEARSRSGKTIEISNSKVDTLSEGAILEEYLPEVPQSSKYDLLNKLRTAKALMSPAARRQLLAIRILAVTNLAYVYPEAIFKSKVLDPDSDEPKRLQLAYQLAELVHSGGNGDSKTPQYIQTLAFGALEALTKHKNKVPDVCSALNVNVNHGVLLYVTRKAVGDMAGEGEGVDTQESHEWREALFSLLSALPISSPRTADTLVSAGLIQIFVDVLNLRSKSAERVYPKVMQYLDNFVHQVRDAFQTLANAKGLDAIAGLTNYEVESASELVSQGRGLPEEYKTQMTDYDVPFFQQQTLRTLFKFVNHMMQHGGGNVDRLLRNLIDSPQLLSALRQVLGNARIFGSNIWSGAVNIMSSFIHNEPTSYNIIAEAGLSKTFLESIMSSPLEVPELLKSPTVPPVSPTEDTMDTDPTSDDSAGPGHPLEGPMQNGEPAASRQREYKVIRLKEGPLAQGILPANEAIASIPQAFGAICLNSSGLKLFRASNALESFFEIFESPAHVKIMKNDTNLLRVLGSSFDELVRHHPALKNSVMDSILTMVARVAFLCRSQAWTQGVGTKLWVEGNNGELEVSGGPRSLLGDVNVIPSEDGTTKVTASAAAMVTTMDLPSGDKLVSGSEDDLTPMATPKGIEKEEDDLGLAVANYISAVCKFLGGFFENQGLCSAFVEAGGTQYVLDYATLPSLAYDFCDHEASKELALVIHMMAEAKHHLVLPSLVHRALTAVRDLSPFYQSRVGPGFFEGLTTREESPEAPNDSFAKDFTGTFYAKKLVMVHTLIKILHEVYTQQVYPVRPSQAAFPFSQVNLGDMYSELVLSLGKLQGACVKNEILLQNSLSDSWKEATRIKVFGMRNSEADAVFGIVHHQVTFEQPGEINSDDQDAQPSSTVDNAAQLSNGTPPRSSKVRKGSVMREEHQAAFKNVHTLRYLLSSLPSSITSFFHVLGKGLMPKRRNDPYQRQSASAVADALADALIDQLKMPKGELNDSLVDRYAYWIVALSSLSQLMIEHPLERPQPQSVTVALLAFQRKDGLKVLEEITESFIQEVNASSASDNNPSANRRLASAYGALKIILSFFSQITTSRTIIEATQTQTMTQSSERDKDKPDYFLAAQFLLELRMAVVPVARRMWDSKTELIVKAPSSIAKCLIEILRSILDGEGEKGAFKRNDNLPVVSATEKVVFKINRDRVDTLVKDRGFEIALAKEALFRCNNLLTPADEYCKSFTKTIPTLIPRCPVPISEIEKSPSRSLSTPRRHNSDADATSSAAATAGNDTLTTAPEAEGSSSTGANPLASVQPSGDESSDPTTSTVPDLPSLANGNAPTDHPMSAMSIDNLLNVIEGSMPGLVDPQLQSSGAMDVTPSATPNGSRTLPSLKQREAVRVEDLDVERSSIRSDLLDRCLDVLTVHYDVTFELADLIAAAIRSSKGDDFRTDVGEVLVTTLTSFPELEGNFQPMGKKVAAYANLTALVLQDNKTYEAAKSTLQDSFPALLGFIKIFPSGPDAPAEDHSPWIGQILLIVEKLLSDDAEPPTIEFTPPGVDAPISTEPVTRLEKAEIIPSDEKIALFDAIVDVLPRIGKDESLALSAARTLVMLTRIRKIATRLAEKRNLQRLFLMVKQLANITNERLQSSFMLILRHIVEDEDTVRQIMRAEIVSAFEARTGRQINTSEYLRQMYHLVLRDPYIFVEVTNEKLMVPKYESVQRPQNLALKIVEKRTTEQPAEAASEEQAEASTDRSKSSEDQKPSATTTSVEEDKQPLEKSKTSEMKAPVVEHPDGVIHYLLSELLSYKDVEDKDAPKPTAAPAASSSTTSQSDVEMTNGEAPPSEWDVPSLTITTPATSKKADKPEKPEFKGEEHPIYIYRCFILQCLTELLSSYNRTKVEFINFSRKADPFAMTPSKPRSGVLNYLLNSLIPVGTLEHEESISFKKRSNTSSWAMRVIVALCSKSGEILTDSSRPRDFIDEEGEPDLLFVRKFVLGHALSAYKDASATAESLDIKYARMMCIADLFDRMLTTSSAPETSSYLSASQRLLARTMFEKNFIAALTSSIADIDLNFPGSKRAVKYILRPLSKLTQTAVILSETSSISTPPGQTDEDDISSATSVSDLENEREETPDLFRHSTLGMFEQHREEESSSESSEEDEEMYDDGYDDEMEYEEDGLELDGDAGDVISEEDELDGPGHMEGLPGDVDMHEIEVVVDGDEEDDDDELDSDEDEDDSEDDDEDVNDIGYTGEINGDDEGASLGEGEEGDGWESEEDEEGSGVFEGGHVHVEHDGSHEPDSDVHDDLPAFGTLLRVMGEGGEEHTLDLTASVGVEGAELDFLGEDGPDDEEDEEDEDDMDDEEVAFEHEFGEEDDPSLPTGTWGWELDEPHIHRAGGGFHHHHHRGLPSPWSLMPPGAVGTIPGGGGHRVLPIPTGGAYRSHRPQGAQRQDDGTNPLLQRADRVYPGVGSARPSGPEPMTDWVHAIEPIFSNAEGNRMFAMESPVTLLNAIMSAIGREGGPPGMLPRGGNLQFTFAGPGGARLEGLPGRLQALIGMRPPAPVLAGLRTSRDDPSQAVTFVPGATMIRWQEESRILYGNHYFEKAQLMANPILRVLVPPAILEVQREKAKAEKERQRKAEEERLAKEEAERLKKEQECREAKEKAEREEREAIEAENARNAAADAAAAQELGLGDGDVSLQDPDLTAGESTEPMEGVEATDPGASTTENAEASSSAAEAGLSEQAPRVYTTIRGRQLDITEMQIDQEYLEALPEEIREEVIMQQLAEQRSQQAATGEEPSEINAEFLEALPPEIREELLQQEAQDRRRRERDQRRRAAGASGAAAAEEMDGASFIATLDPHLRQAVLADQPEEVLARLGPEFVNEARALTGRRMPNLHDMPRLNRDRDRHHPLLDQALKKPPRRQIVQMLDKAGVATLLRLMFMPQQGSGKQYLQTILHDVCENRQNRGEVVSLLLSILQDGSADVNAVERSFAQLSLRAKQPGLQKTPQPLKRTLSTQTAPTTNTDLSPLMVVQQCLSALVFLTQYNAHIAIFFLTPHESSSGLKSKAQRKGKGKEDKATKYALNALLTLLDRKLIMDSSSCMEALSSLLSTITQPLIMLLKKDKEKPEEVAKTDDKVEEVPADSIASVEDTATAPTTEEATAPADATMTEAAPIEATESSTEQAPASVEQAESMETNQPENAAGETSSAEKGDDTKKEEEEEEDEDKPKKQRILEPPVVPEHNLRLVVNILAARECNGKTFRETLSTINNLSAIPGAKEIFGKELIAQAQDLSSSIHTDLIELIPNIKEAQTGTEIQGMALAKFSPASSDQAKLLRILTALDYLFDPKRSDSKSKDGFDGKEDLLTTLYESSTFGPLWTKLSECLSAIRQRDNMINVATILLPLIEALMVVCKNTTLKETPRNIREFSVQSPVPESGMESLFFNFTEEHRKVLNELVRHNPKLMSGTFSLLVKNPKVLEFDNKRNYFSRRLHSRGSEQRHPQPPLQLSVRRDQVFLDSFKSLYFKTPDEMKYGKLSIRFHGEEGVDAGGVTREWFQVLARGMFNPNYALFIPVASDRTTFHPNRLSSVNSEHLMFFKFIGRIIGKALYEGRVLDCHFSRAVYKRILGKAVSIKDMETLDLDYYKSLLWMLENDITDIITENFAVETDDFGEKRTIDLIENGRNIPVTEENKQEYVQLVVENRMTGSVQEQLENFLKGFHDIIPAELISIFNEQELELLISGLPDIDVDDWKNNAEYHNYSASSSQIQWFWRAVRSFDKEERAKLLQFVTGTSKVPLNGFKELEGMNGFSKFNIHRDYGNKDRLPSSHTCFNQLDLPEYETYEQLRQRLYTAMTTGGEYFGFA